MDNETNGVAVSLLGGLLLSMLVFASLYSYSKVEDIQYQKEPVQTGVVESKDINYTSGFLGSETKHFHVEIDGRAYKISMEDWNKIKEDEEVEYVEGNNGKIRVTETGN